MLDYEINKTYKLMDICIYNNSFALSNIFLFFSMSKCLPSGSS